MLGLLASICVVFLCSISQAILAYSLTFYRPENVIGTPHSVPFYSLVVGPTACTIACRAFSSCTVHYQRGQGDGLVVSFSLPLPSPTHECPFCAILLLIFLPGQIVAAAAALLLRLLSLLCVTTTTSTSSITLHHRKY